MKFRVIMLTAMGALFRNKMRSALTALGLIIGVGAVIVSVGIGNGAKQQVEAQIASMGDNVILVFSGSVSRGGTSSGYGGSGTLSVDDALALAREIPALDLVSPSCTGNSRVAAGNQNWSTKIYGASPEYFDIRRWNFAHGAPFTDRDVRTSAKVCVIGNTVAVQLFGDPESALGQTIRIKRVPFTVIGLLRVKGADARGQDQDDTVVMPYTSAMKRVLGTKTLSLINISVKKGESIPAAVQQITEVLAQRHHSGPDRDADFRVLSQEEIAQMATATSKIMGLLLTIVASVSLIIGGIGIMNIMLVSVTERTREIGIRMAIGARGSDILLQFFIEAITLSCLGGLTGIAVGLGSAQLVSKFAGMPVLITSSPILLAFGVSVLVGVTFGFYPAIKASSLDPIEALRYE
jgi:putative ABC transport system permease protein